MKIDQLLTQQDKDSVLFQREFHNIIDRIVKQYGFEGNKPKEEIKRQLDLKMPHYIKKGLRLGLKWLE